MANNDSTDLRHFEKDERELLRKMYDAHEMMEELLDGGKDDPDYVTMGRLICRLENYIINKNQQTI